MRCSAFARPAWPLCRNEGLSARPSRYMRCGMPDAVVHNPAKHRFELNLEGETVVTEYRSAGGVMTFYHTLTPPALRGRGLAAKVVQAALEYARAEGLKVIPLCWYVNEHIKHHPEFRALLAPQPG